MDRLYGILLICVFSIGCAALMTEQTYLRVDVPVIEKFIFSGVVYSIPEPKEIRKIIILGEGKVQNIDIYARDSKFNWKEIKKINTPPSNPHALVFLLGVFAWVFLRISSSGM